MVQRIRTWFLRGVLSAALVAVAVSGVGPSPAAAQQPSSGQKLANAAQHKNMQLVGHNDLQARSAYQPLAHKQGGRWIAYVGHHAGSALNPLTGQVEPNGTSIVDVTNPGAPVYLYHLPPSTPGQRQAQFVQVCDGSALPNADANKVYLLRADGNAGHEIFDVTTPSAPQFVSTVVSGLRATHKNYWDCGSGYAYLVSDGRPYGWAGSRILQVFDLSNPASPTFVRNFGLPGQQPGGDPATAPPGPHEATALGNRVYVAYGTDERGVMQILDRDKLIFGDPSGPGYDPISPSVADLEFPQIGRFDMPSYWGGHTAWPLLGVDMPEYAKFAEDPAAGSTATPRDFVVLVSEATANECREHMHHMAFFVDITEPSKPFPVSNYQVPESSGDFCSRGGRFGTHSTQWSYTPTFYKKLQFFAYFNAGVRAVDVRDPFHPKEVGYFIPATTPNTDVRCVTDAGVQRCKVAIQTNNVEVDDRGYIYLADRANTGLHIVEVTGAARKVLE